MTRNANMFFCVFCAFLAKKLNLKTEKFARFFFKWLWRHLKSDRTPILWVPTRPQWRGGCLGTHKPRGWQQKKMKKMTFLKKLIFSKKLNFSKKWLFLIFLFSQSQLYGYPRDPLAIVVAWVPITGVYNNILGASRPI